jgi:hypothetical protein
MHAAAAWAVSVTTGKAWLRALAALGLAALASSIAWAVQHPLMLAWLAPLATLAGVLALGRKAWHRAPLRLAWDGEQWWLGPVAGAADASRAARPGQVVVAMDLGAWLLLRFEAADAPRQRRWLPLQQGPDGGLDPAAWHRLRCTVHLARTASADAPRSADRGA